MTLLDEIGHGEAVMSELGRNRDHQTHMGCGQAVESDFVPLLFPTHRETALFFPFQERSVHCVFF